MVRDTGKVRRTRIELGYYRGSDRIGRWRGWLCLGVIGCIAGWLGLEAVAGRDRSTGARIGEPSVIASKGPLVQAHALWDSTCQACHVPFTPINSSEWAPVLTAGSTASNDQCRTCHAGPAHHPAKERQEDIPACASCHIDHRGREASLLAMDDSVCTRCHANLAGHMIPGATTRVEDVTRFDTVHPQEFKPNPVDRSKSPGRVKFNHARHLAAGLPLKEGGALFTFAYLAEKDRNRYGWEAGQSVDSPVHLKCAACHQLDGDDAASAGGPVSASQTPPRLAGAYMLPVTYDRHCAACHPLAFDSEPPREKLRPGVQPAEVFQVRHGVQPVKVVEQLRRFYAARAVSADQGFLHKFVPPRPLPDRPSGASEERFNEAIETNVATAGRLLFGAAIDQAVLRQLNLPQGRRGCVECHNLKPHAERLAHSTDFAALEVEPVLMTPVWLESAFFNHTTHRALDCAACHAGVDSSERNGDQPLLPGRAACTACHTAEGNRWSGQPPAAGTSCTECHRYHDGDHPARGLGALSRRGAAQFSVEQFQKGWMGAKSGESTGVATKQTTR
jgi:predicted CXXCH cytochrome family protein